MNIVPSINPDDSASDTKDLKIKITYRGYIYVKHNQGSKEKKRWRCSQRSRPQCCNGSMFTAMDYSDPKEVVPHNHERFDEKTKYELDKKIKDWNEAEMIDKTSITTMPVAVGRIRK